MLLAYLGIQVTAVDDVGGAPWFPAVNQDLPVDLIGGTPAPHSGALQFLPYDVLDLRCLSHPGIPDFHINEEVASGEQRHHTHHDDDDLAGEAAKADGIGSLGGPQADSNQKTPSDYEDRPRDRAQRYHSHELDSVRPVECGHLDHHIHDAHAPSISPGQALVGSGDVSHSPNKTDRPDQPINTARKGHPSKGRQDDGEEDVISWECLHQHRPDQRATRDYDQASGQQVRCGEREEAVKFAHELDL